ncbi:MAG: hypothetical protein RL341_1508 [Pseudomonadota bacterium]|jgi:hypothetical protein
MSKDTIAYYAPDISALARTLATETEKLEKPPSHLSWLNILSRAAGHRNYQSLRAAHSKQSGVAPPSVAAPVALSEHAVKALGHFDDIGRLTRWPNKFAVQRLALWGLWMHVDAKRVYTERAITNLLRSLNCFDDPVTLRRELINMKMLSRKPDGSAYRKEQVRAPDEAAALMHALRQRLRASIAARGRGTPAFSIH